MTLLKFSFSGSSLTAAKFSDKSRQFQITIDEPVKLGGTDQYPNPVEHILAGYAGCLNVVAHIVAKELDISLYKLEIHLSGELNPAKLAAKKTTQRAGFQHIGVTLKPITDASDTLLLKWLDEIEKRCPVGDNLKNSTPIVLQVDKQTFNPALN